MSQVLPKEFLLFQSTLSLGYLVASWDIHPYICLSPEHLSNSSWACLCQPMGHCKLYLWSIYPSSPCPTSVYQSVTPQRSMECLPFVGSILGAADILELGGAGLGPQEAPTMHHDSLPAGKSFPANLKPPPASHSGWGWWWSLHTPFLLCLALGYSYSTLWG